MCNNLNQIREWITICKRKINQLKQDFIEDKILESEYNILIIQYENELMNFYKNNMAYANKLLQESLHCKLTTYKTEDVYLGFFKKMNILVRKTRREFLKEVQQIEIMLEENMFNNILTQYQFIDLKLAVAIIRNYQIKQLED